MMTPKFKDVPAHWKYPEGPYRQAPLDYGGEWWLINPFASREPWLTQSQPPKADSLPPGFADIFGPRPQASDFRGRNGHSSFQIAVADWGLNLKHFKGVGLPDGIMPEQRAAASDVFESWGMGLMRTYEGRYGWAARFPDSQIPDFDCAARTAIEATHLVIAQYQIALLGRGLTSVRKHPFVPPSVWPDEKE